MTTQTIETAINLICDKIGIAVTKTTELIPLVQKYKIVTAVTGASVCSLFLLVAIISGIIEYKKAVKYIENYRFGSCDLSDYFPWILWCVFGSTTIIVSIIVLCTSIYSLLLWSFCPEISFLNYLKGLI